MWKMDMHSYFMICGYGHGNSIPTRTLGFGHSNTRVLQTQKQGSVHVYF